MKYCPKCRAEYRDGFTQCADCQELLINNLPPIEKPKSHPQPVKVFVAMYPTEATIVKSMLESSGLSPIIFDEMTIALQPFYSTAIGGVKILVPEDEAEDAKVIINEYLNNKETTTDKSRAAKKEKQKITKQCMSCGSQNIIKRYDINKGALLVYILSLIGLLLLPFVKHVYTCMNCGKKWRI